MTELRECKKCRKAVPLSGFDQQRTASGAVYYRTECRPCKRAAWSEWAKTEAGKAAKRRGVLKRSFGLTPEQYQRMHDEQGGVCAICRRAETMTHFKGKLLDLSVDHDHATGRVRALLCAACNAAIGLLQECPERMRAAADYIERQAKAAT